MSAPPRSVSHLFAKCMHAWLDVLCCVLVLDISQTEMLAERGLDAQTMATMLRKARQKCVASWWFWPCCSEMAVCVATMEVLLFERWRCASACDTHDETRA